MDRSNVARTPAIMHRRFLHSTLVAAALTAWTVACDGPRGDADLLSRAEFVDTYVDLRVEALRTEAEVLNDSARAEVLGRHGVSEQELLDFAAAHGADLDFMRDLWNEIEMRLDSVPTLPRDAP